MVVLSQSCSSDNTTKKARVAFDAGASGGEAGEATGGTSATGGSTSRGGTSSGATGGTAGAVGKGGTGSGATGAVAGDSGASSSAAGEAGASNACPTGTGNCDGDPSTCETNLNLVTSCGSCSTSCNGMDIWVCEYDPPGNFNGEKPY